MGTLKLGKYKHSKTGNFYRVLGLAKHSETLEDLVVYECLYDNPRSMLWVRPLNLFIEKIILNDKKVPRFIYIGELE